LTFNTNYAKHFAINNASLLITSTKGDPMKKMYLMLILFIFFATSAFAKININSAPADELAKLNGIGKAKAEAIVAYRTANGNFVSVDDLTKVKGIGSKIVEKIKEEITVNE
jgi:competence protein ComEA